MVAGRNYPASSRFADVGHAPFGSFDAIPPRPDQHTFLGVSRPTQESRQHGHANADRRVGVTFSTGSPKRPQHDRPKLRIAGAR
jgi:hypothetical protein